MNDRVMLRPFQDYIGREQHLDMVQVRGELSGSQFVIAVFGQEVRLEVPEAGEDERGTFALVAPFEVALRDGFRMRLEAEYDEYLPPGAKLAVFLPKDAREAVPGEPQPRGSTAMIPPARIFAVSSTLAAWSTDGAARIRATAGGRFPIDRATRRSLYGSPQRQTAPTPSAPRARPMTSPAQVFADEHLETEPGVDEHRKPRLTG